MNINSTAKTNITKQKWAKIIKVHFFGAPGRTRTRNFLVRSQALYPIELREQIDYFIYGDNRTPSPRFRRPMLCPVALQTHRHKPQKTWSVISINSIVFPIAS